MEKIVILKFFELLHRPDQVVHVKVKYTIILEQEIGHQNELPRFLSTTINENSFLTCIEDQTNVREISLRM